MLKIKQEQSLASSLKWFLGAPGIYLTYPSNLVVDQEYQGSHSLQIHLFCNRPRTLPRLILQQLKDCVAKRPPLQVIGLTRSEVVVRTVITN